jgi:hypothetical protein
MDKLPEELIRHINKFNGTCIKTPDCGLYLTNTWYFKFMKCKYSDYKKDYITGKYQHIDILEKTCIVLNSKEICPFCMGFTENMICKISEIIHRIYSYENCPVKVTPAKYWELLILEKEETHKFIELLPFPNKNIFIKLNMSVFSRVINGNKPIKKDIEFFNNCIKIRPRLEYNI